SSFKTPATPSTYTLSLHDALPIFDRSDDFDLAAVVAVVVRDDADVNDAGPGRPIPVELDRVEPDHEDEVARVDVVVEIRGAESRSEEHTSELQSRGHLVCRLLLEK